MPEFHHSALSATFRLLSKLPPSGRASPVSIACAEDIWDRSRDGHNRRRGKHRRLCSISIEKLNIFLAKFSAEVNVDKRKTVHFFKNRSNRVVFRFAGNFCRIFSAVCSPYCLCCSISVRLSPSCRMLSVRWKSWMSGSNPGGMQSGFRPVQRISQYDANALQPLPCIYTPSRRTLVRRGGEIFQRTS